MHTEHNGDALVAEELTDRHLLLAVADGGGENGHFAATLTVRTLRSLARQTSLRTFAERRRTVTADLLRDTVRDLRAELRQFYARLDLRSDERLVSLVIAVVDREGPRAEVLTVGSGLVNCDGETVSVSQDAAADFLGQDLRTPFSDWWARRTRRARCEDFTELALATDGLLSFRLVDADPYPPISQDEITEFLLTARDEGEPETLYRRQLLYLRERFGQVPTDDLTIVRYTLD